MTDTNLSFPETYGLGNLTGHVGRVFGPGTPVLVDQAKIDSFAEATGDRQWIHVDPERARREGPFGGPIAHGYLTLSLLAAMQMELGIYPADAAGVMNYGLNRVRFLAPVPAGSRVVLVSTLLGVEEKPGRRWLLRVENEIRLADGGPVVMAETLGLVFA